MIDGFPPLYLPACARALATVTGDDGKGRDGQLARVPTAQDTAVLLYLAVTENNTEARRAAHTMGYGGGSNDLWWAIGRGLKRDAAGVREALEGIKAERTGRVESSS